MSADSDNISKLSGALRPWCA